MAIAEQGVRRETLHSYEEFTQRPFYKAVNSKTIDSVPIAQRIVDIATGTGEMVSQLVESGRVFPYFKVIGLDIDESALRAAKEKFTRYQDQITFAQASAENIPIKNNWADLVTFCNAIHLTDPRLSIREAARILAPNGTLVINSAYESTYAFPESSEASWGALVAFARINARKRGISNIPKPVQLTNYSFIDYINMLTRVGFDSIQVDPHEAQMNRDDVKAICGYDEFARGAMPGVDLEIAKECLVEAVEPMFERRKQDTIPRGWMILKAKKI